MDLEVAKTDLQTESVSCNLCGQKTSTVLYEFEDVLYDIPGQFVMRQCTNCGLMYLSPRPTLESIERFYPIQYSSYRPPIEEEGWRIMRWVRRRKLTKRRHLIEKYSRIDGNGRILDVGCATGLFLHEMDQAGWKAEGIELVESAANFARDTFDLNVFQGTLSEAPYELEAFDAVTFWDVLEHTFSPTQELMNAARVLKPGGLLAISVPNWDSYERRWFGKHWQGFDPPRHLYVFDRRTLSHLLEEAGFIVLDWVCFMPSYFSFIISLNRWLSNKNGRLAHVIDKILNLPGMRLPFEPWFALSNALGKGSVISVFAQKRQI